MASFDDFGLREPLLSVLEDVDIEFPTALQQAVIPVLRRGGNVVARTGSGSGKTLGYALGILDRIEATRRGEDDSKDAVGLRVLVLVATAEAAERVALSLVPFAHALELGVAIPGDVWGTGLGEAEVVVAAPSDVLTAIRGSALKLETVDAIVIDGASDIEALGGWEAVETVFDHAPREAQRVVISAAITDGVSDLIDRRVKRAIRFPTEAAVPEENGARAISGVIGYVLVTEREKLDVLSRLVGQSGGGGAPVLMCRTDERAAAVAEALTLRGFLAGEIGDADADVVIVGSGTTAEELAGDGEEAPAVTISYDVPGDEHTLLARHGGTSQGFVLLEPRELMHLHEIAKRAGLEPRPAGITGEGADTSGELRAFRQELRRAISQDDLGAQMLVLEPLFEEFTAAEVAAAAAALLRRKLPIATAGPAASLPIMAAAQSTTSRPERAERQSEPAGPAPATYARLFVGVGERDGIRAGDLVGAIAGEADIPGTKVGRIEIRDTFSIVEVPSELADRVIRAVNGTTVKGRSVRVDYDRGGVKRPGAGRPAEGRGGFAGRGAAGGRPGPGGGAPRGDREGGGPSRTPTRRPPPRS